MSELKTQPTDASVTAFLNTVEDPGRRADYFTVMEIMGRVTGEPRRMFGSSIVGFGQYQYTYASGRSGKWFLCGFSPRKRALTLYIMPRFSQYDGLMARLGEHKTGKSCLYVRRLADVDLGVLETLVAHSVDHMRRKYPA